MSAAEKWNLLSDADDGDGTSALDRFLAISLAKKLRSKWNQTQTVVLEFKRGSDWYSASLGIEMPDDGKGVTPDGGARYLIGVARDFSANHQHNVQLRLNALGESQSGATSKSLWLLGLDFNDDDDGGGPSPKDDVKGARASEVTRMMEINSKGAEDAYSQRNTAIDQTTALVDKLMEMAELATNNQAGLLEAHKLEMQDRHEGRVADAYAASEERHSKRVDKVFDSLLGLGSKLLERTLRSKFGMGSDVFEGSYSTRLAAILKKIPADKQDAAKKVLGDDVWRLLQDAAKGVSDDAFRELVRQTAEAMPSNHTKTFMALAVAIENQGVVMALAKLLTEASD